MDFDFDDELPDVWTVETLNKHLDSLVVGETLRIEDLPNEIYHRTQGVSTSKLKVFMRSPYVYEAMYVSRTVEFEEKPYFSFGRAGHTTVLEPHKFDKEFTCMPDYSGTGSVAKRDLFKSQSKREGKEILTQEQWDAQPLIKKSIEAHPRAARYVTGGIAEVSYFIRDKETGLIIKARPDYMKGNIIVDLKTADTVDRRFLPAKFKKLGYHIQDALYSDVVGADGFGFVVIESSNPYRVVAPVEFRPELKRLGYLQYRKAMRELKKCIDSGYWPMDEKENEALFLEPNKFDKDELQKLENENEQ